MRRSIAWTMLACALSQAPSLALAGSLKHKLLGVKGGTDPATQGYEFDLDPDTGSVWLSSSLAAGQQLVAEWKADGRMIGVNDAFSPFTYRSSRANPAFGVNLIPSYFDGHFGIAVDNRSFYRRGDDGQFTVSEVFTRPARLGCHETPATAGCQFFASGIDARGQRFVAVLDQASQAQTRFWDDHDYRALTSTESLALADLSSLEAGALVWSPDQSTALAVVPGSMGQQLTLRQYSAAGISTHTMDSGNATFDPSQVTLQRAGADVFLVGSETLNSQVTPALYRVKDPFGTSPTLEPVVIYDGRFIAFGNVFLDPTHFYFLSDGGLFAQPLAGGAATRLVDCPSSNGPTLLTSAVPNQAPWVVCGSTTYRLAAGAVSLTLPFSGSISFGSVLLDQNGAYDVVAQTADGSLLRFRSNQANLVSRILPVGRAPVAFRTSWPEASGPCGVDYSSSSLYCRINGQWLSKDLGIGFPFATTKSATMWWAVSTTATQAQLYRRAAGGVWAQVGAWPYDGKAQPNLVHLGLDEVGLDLGDTGIYLPGQQSLAYPHPRSSASVAVGVSVDGTLYDLCTNKETSNLYLCAIQLDGTTKAVSGLLAQTFLYEASIVPLKKGVLAAINGSLFVVREGRSIAIGKLYGELMSITGEYSYLYLNQTDDGAAIITRMSFAQGTFAQQLDYYRYDGESLTTVPLTPTQHGFPAISLFSTPASVNGPPVQIWRGDDGVWRTPGGNQGEPWAMGWTAADALVGNEEVAPDYASDVLLSTSAGVVMGTDDGVWTCPVASATHVLATTIDLPQTAGCQRKLALPYVKRLIEVAGGFVLQQGQRIVQVTGLSEATLKTLSHGVARNLSGNTDTVTWLEKDAGGQDSVVNYDLRRSRFETTQLPAQAGAVVELEPDWLCALGGVYHKDQAQWTAVQGLSERCEALTSLSGEAVVATSGQLFRCTQDGCTAAATLPVSFYPDGVLGRLQDGRRRLAAAVVLGKQVFRLERDDTLADVTPRYQGDSPLLLAPASTLAAPGVISTRGAGVVMVPPSPLEAWHVRPQ